RRATAATARTAPAQPPPRTCCVRGVHRGTKDRATFAQLVRIPPGRRLVPAPGRGGFTVRSRLNLDRSLPALAVGAVLALGLVGCNNPAGALMNEPEATALPPIKVDLPPPPSFAEPNIPLQYPDGTMSIYGMRKHLNKYLGQNVKVKAYLLEIYQ